MPSTAISAQGTTLQIGTGSGAPVTVTGVAVGNPTVITAAAHGFNNGDYITFSAGFTGANAADLNGKSFTVLYKTTNTFAVAFDTTGHTITAGTATATPTTFTAIGNIRSFQGFDGAASELDKTNMSSVAKEFALGLVDPGQLAFEVDYDLTDPGQIALRAKQQSSGISSFKMTLPNADVLSFSGYVKKFGTNGGVDQLLKVPVDIRITGAVTKTP